MNTPVDFTTAKLLKEKGFNNKVSHYWNYNGEVLFSYKPKTDPINYTMAPTITEVVMWLYEKHGIWIEVVWDIELNKELKWYSGITNVGDSSELEIFQSNPCDTPTEAYSQAIEYTLKNLI